MLVFIHINKTAGRTVRYILRSSYGMRHCEAEPWRAAWDGPFTAADLHGLRRIYPRLASIAGHRLTGCVDLDGAGRDLRYFTFLRDPLKLTASRFQAAGLAAQRSGREYHVEHRGMRDLVFEEWVQREWLRNPQTRQIGGTARVEDAIRTIENKGIFVGLTERFDESVLMLKSLRAPDLDIRYTPVNVAKSSRLAQELLADPRAREAIVAVNVADVALYEYAKTELYPAIVREYGGSLEAALSDLRAQGSGSFSRPLLRLHRKASTRPVVRALMG